MSTTGSASFHGIDLHVRANDADLLNCLLERFAAFPPASGNGLAAHVELTMTSTPPPAEGDPGRVVYESEFAKAWYDPATDRLLADFADVGTSRSSFASASIRVDVRNTVPRAIWAATRPLFTIAFVELLKRHGLCFLHASAVATSAGAILFPGASGSGKSTLALALARSGFALMGDDVIFLRRDPDGIVVLPFPDQIDLTDHSIELLGALGAGRRVPGALKSQVSALELGCAIETRPVLAAAVVFPSLHAARTSWMPVDAGEALLALTPNVLLTEPRSTQEHLDLLADLVSEVSAFRLEQADDSIAASVAAVEEIASGLRTRSERGDPNT